MNAITTIKATSNFPSMVFLRIEPVHATEQVNEQVAEQEKPKDGLVKGLVINLVKELVKELPDTQIKILNLVSEDKHLTISAMAKQLGTSTTTIDNHIELLKNKNVLQRVGDRKTGYWQIIEQE